MIKLTEKQKQANLKKVYVEINEEQKKIFKKLWVPYYNRSKSENWAKFLQECKIKIEIGDEKGDKILRISNKQKQANLRKRITCIKEVYVEIYEEIYEEQKKIFKKLWLAYYKGTKSENWAKFLQENKINIKIEEDEKGDKILRISNKGAA